MIPIHFALCFYIKSTYIKSYVNTNLRIYMIDNILFISDLYIF